MKHASLVKALTKAGFSIQGDDEAFEVVRGDFIVKWTKQDDEAVCLVRGLVSNPGDVMTDYFPYFGLKSIAEAVKYLESRDHLAGLLEL